MLDTGAQDKKSENPMAALDAAEAPAAGGGAGGGAGTTFSSAGPLPPVAVGGGAAAGPSASDLAFGDAVPGGPGAAIAGAVGAGAQLGDTAQQVPGAPVGAALGAQQVGGAADKAAAFGAGGAQQADGGATTEAKGAAQVPEEVAAAGGGSQAAAGGAVTKAPPEATTGGGQNAAFAEAQAIANQGIAAMSGAPGLVVNPPPAQAPAQAHGGALAAPSPGSEAGGGLAVKPEAGVVGSLQLDYDMCTGRLALIGWVWAGIGAAVQTPLGKQWWGAYTFLEGTICETMLDFMPKLPHGPKPPKKEGEKEEGVHGGWGIAGFPIVLSPGKMGKFKQAGLEVGILVTPDADHNGASVELIALLDVLGYLGPVAAAAKKAVEAANALTSKVGLSVEMAAGIDASGVVHGWRSPNGLVVDSARVAGGGFVAMGIGLPHSRSALPKGGG